MPRQRRGAVIAHPIDFLSPFARRRDLASRGRFGTRRCQQNVSNFVDRGWAQT